jgi:hypothetical protein
MRSEILAHFFVKTASHLPYQLVRLAYGARLASNCAQALASLET